MMAMKGIKRHEMMTMIGILTRFRGEGSLNMRESRMM